MVAYYATESLEIQRAIQFFIFMAIQALDSKEES